jgi:serpin B
MRHYLLLFTILLTNVAFSQNPNLGIAYNHFAFDLYKKISIEDKNTFISSIGVYLMLMTLNEGADSITRADFKSKYNIEEGDVLRFITPLKYKPWLSESDFENNLKTSNSIWVHKDISLNDSYKNSIKVKFNSTLETIDFNDKFNSVNKINDWVSINTNNTIKKIISEEDIRNNTAFILLNTVYYNGSWAKCFDKDSTREATFYSSKEREFKMNFMNREGLFDYFENSDFQYISLPYKGGGVSFAIISPKTRNGITLLEDKINAKLLLEVFRKSELSNVELSIPKFSFESEYQIKQPLINLGYKNIMSSEFGLVNITKDFPVDINNIKHKTFVEIDEYKTVASAVTMSDLIGSVKSKIKNHKYIFIANHPFLFLIVDDCTNGILFMGKFVGND